MLQEQVIPIPFGQGLDLKTDPKSVQAGKFLRLENCAFTKPSQISKRNGYTAIGSLTAPKMVHGYQHEVLAADQNNLYAYSSSQNSWEFRGNYISTEISKGSIDQAHSASGYVDCAILGNYALYGWSTEIQTDADYGSGPSKTFGSVVDLSTGTAINSTSNVSAIPQTSTLLSTGGTAALYNLVKCITLSSTSLYIVYLKADASALVGRLVTFSGGFASFGAEQTLTTNLSASQFFFDIVSTSTGASLAYFSTTGVTIANINTSGAVTSSVNNASANAKGPICLSLNGTNFWVYWCVTTGGPPATANAIKYAIYTTVLTPVLATTNLSTQATPYYVSNIIAVTTAATQQTVYYGKYLSTTIGGGSPYTDETISITANSDGTHGLDTPLFVGVTPYSKAFTDSGVNYAVFIYRSAKITVDGTHDAPFAQPTYFVLNLSLGINLLTAVAARFGYGQGNSQNSLENIIGFTPTICTISANKYLIPCSLVTQEMLTDAFVSTNYSAGGIAGAFAYTIDFNSNNAYRAVTAGQLTILNGAIVSNYDGQYCNELGFHLIPEIVSATAVTSIAPAGTMAAGTYNYIAIFQWTDALGNLHQSAPSTPVSVTVGGGGSNAVNITVDTAYLSNKLGVSIAIYRTVGTPATGSIYYLITDPSFPLSADASVSTGTQAFLWVDVFADASITANPQAYTFPASSVLENSTPPPSMAMVPHNNRLWFVDSENPNDVWYTKSFSPGTGLSPSGFMLEQIDPKFGNISALSEMDEKLVIFKDSGIFVQSGDGVSDTGSGSSLSFPQIVPSDVGCSVLKSTVITPKGVMFKSINGIYILDRSLNVSYIGAEVEQYNSQVITGATLIPGKSQIRFLCSTGLTLVYDYIFNQWATFTAHTGVSSSTWNNLYVYSTGTSIFQEAVGVYADNGVAFSLLAQTAWLALGGVQGFQRVKRFIMLGDYTNGNSASHNLSVSAAYDFSTTFQPAIPSPSFGLASTSNVFQYRERLPIQKCDSISLLIQENTTGSNLEYVNLTNMSFEAGIKKGVNKLGGLKSVG